VSILRPAHSSNLAEIPYKWRARICIVSLSLSSYRRHISFVFSPDFTRQRKNLTILPIASYIHIHVTLKIAFTFPDTRSGGGVGGQGNNTVRSFFFTETACNEPRENDDSYKSICLKITFLDV